MFVPVNIFQSCRELLSIYYLLTLCFACFLSSADFFLNQLFQKNSFKNTIRVSNSLDPDQVSHYIGPDPGRNCLQKLSSGDTSRQRVEIRP